MSRPREVRPLPCSGCGATFHATGQQAWSSAKGNRIFCVSCRATKGPREVIRTACARCATEFEPVATRRYRAKKGERVYCSPACQYQGMPRAIPCTHCGSIFTATASQASRYRAGLPACCSADCRVRLRRHLAPEGHKRCTKCEVEQPKAFFNANATSADGVHAWCRACCAVLQLRYLDLGGTRITLAREIIPDELERAVRARSILKTELSERGH